MAKVKKKSVSSSYIELYGLLSLMGSFFLFLSLFSYTFVPPQDNWLGIIGHFLGIVLHYAFGLVSFALPMLGATIGYKLLFSQNIERLQGKVLIACVSIISLCLLFTIVEDSYPLFAREINQLFYPYWSQKKSFSHLGGTPINALYKELPYMNLKILLNASGVALISGALFLGSFLYLFKLPLRKAFHSCKTILEQLLIRPVKEKPLLADEPQDFMRHIKLKLPKEKKIEEEVAPKPAYSEKAQVKEPSYPITYSVDLPLPPIKEKLLLPHDNRYQLPSLSLLTPAKKVDQTDLKKDLKKQAEVLEETLMSFGIEAKVGQINCGPTITSFEVHPAIGVKVQKIKTLENDIALNLEAKSIRIIAPIPGKAAVGIEVPNLYPQEVGFKEMLATYQQGSKKFRIPLLLGKAVNGDYVMSDLTKMPHCIIAGATGSGKSVCINTIVMAILYTLRPDEVRLLMIDPKKVELTPYSRLPHMIAPVITEPQGAANALNWLVKEMEMRYEILKQIGVRNIEGFNERKRDQALEESLSIEVPEKMPYIVAIIDELADLMMVSSNDIETPIARMAQMARAVGIHLILATQRPSREVITGLIKANFPTRISFKVASRINSQIVLDEVGAESLLGNGDMLFLPPGTSQLVRAQGAFIRDEDISRVVQFIQQFAPPKYLIPSFDELEIEDKGPNDADCDALFHDALRIVQSAQLASTTFLQRKLKIGYARAASLIDQLEERGYVSEADGAKPRKVLKPLK